jgi:hypothetical protein
MSTYRKFAPALRNVNDIRNDVYAIETMKQSLVRRLSPQLRIERDEYKHLRKASPASTPLRRTLEWVERLPPRVRPMALMRQFARVANLIAATWDHLDDPAWLSRTSGICYFSDVWRATWQKKRY